MEAILLRFNSPVHFGSGGDELDKTDLIYHSDALKSALFAVGMSLFPEWENTADDFFGGFHISSCFPFAKGELFLPKPYVKGIFAFNDSDGSAKKAKKVQFLSSHIFESFINTPEDREFSVSDALVTPDGLFICETEKTAAASFFKSAVQQRVAVPLPGEKQDTTPFYLDRLYFEDDCGMYFLADFKGNENLRRQVLLTLRLLGEQGIGTDRAVGNGRFNFNMEQDVKPFKITLSGIRNRWMSMGLYLPTQDELHATDLDNSAWQLIQRGGYMGGTHNPEFIGLRKKSVYFFTPGSTFSCSQMPNGKVENLKPDWDTPMHDVWRDGQCIFLKL